MGVVHFHTPESLADYAYRRLIVRAHVTDTDLGHVKVLIACCKDDEMEVVIWEGERSLRVQRFTPTVSGGEACLEALSSFCLNRCRQCSEMLRYSVETIVVKDVRSDTKTREGSSGALYLLPVYGQIQERLRVMNWSSSQADSSCLSLLQFRFDAFVRRCVSGARDEIADILG
jgi:hypothetical protein